MVYVCMDGRVVYDKKYLGACKEYLEFDDLPEAPEIEGKIGFIIGFNNDTEELLFRYEDEPEIVEPDPEPEPVYNPTRLDKIEANIDYLVMLNE